jgi:acetyl-CoA C-acetyltransferase
MLDAYVIGAAQTDFGSFPETSYRSLFQTAFERAQASVVRGLERTEVEEAFVGMLGVGGRQLGLAGPATSEQVGIHDVPCTRVENACASSGYAMQQAVRAVRSGAVDVALAGGVEVMTDLSSDATKYWLGVSGETEWERMAGTTFAGVYAQMAAAHMDAYGTTKEQLSHVAVKNHANGSRNPHAQLGFECSLEDAMNAPTVSDPLNLFDCCPSSDGAAVAIVASERVVDEYADDRVRVAGVGSGSDRIGVYERDSYTNVPAARSAAERAYEEAGLGPADLDVAEVHDCFTIAEVLAIESIGFYEPGEGIAAARNGETTADGDRPVNLSGGLKAKGHPVGATGVSQVIEIASLLTGEHINSDAVPDAEVGLVHNAGGTVASTTVHVMEVVE